MRHMSMESLYEYGSRAGLWRLLRMFEARGLPLTVFGAELDTRYLVVEMGADAPVNIAELSTIVRPDLGAVLMVGSAHAEKFGGAHLIAQTKGELAEAVPASGHLILNADDPQVVAMAQRAAAPVTWIAEGEPSPDAVVARSLQLDAEGHPTFTLCLAGQEHQITSGLIGAVIGGAVANVIDRARDGVVTDYLHTGWWPTFNLADTFLVVGCITIALAQARPQPTLAGDEPTAAHPSPTDAGDP